MNISLIFIGFSLALVTIIASIAIGFKKKIQPRTTWLGSLSFGFIIAGIFFSERRITGYSLLGIGVLLAIIDIGIKLKKSE